jgi:hypothetical protein
MSLAEYAKKDRVKTGYTAWRELNDENKLAWGEAVKGFKSGIAASVVARWLQNEKQCPLTDATIRTQLAREID